MPSYGVILYLVAEAETVLEQLWHWVHYVIVYGFGIGLTANGKISLFFKSTSDSPPDFQSCEASLVSFANFSSYVFNASGQSDSIEYLGSFSVMIPSWISCCTDFVSCLDLFVCTL